MLINNKGDVGRTLKDMANSQTVKNTIIAAGVAGVTSYTDGWGTTCKPVLSQEELAFLLSTR